MYTYHTLSRLLYKTPSCYTSLTQLLQKAKAKNAQAYALINTNKKDKAIQATPAKKARYNKSLLQQT
jgi:hypothetical protein